MRHHILIICRATQSQMRQRRAGLFVVLEESLSMRQLRHPLISTQYSIASRYTSRAKSPACALAMDESLSHDLVSRVLHDPAVE
jgi:hypothetical protein